MIRELIAHWSQHLGPLGQESLFAHIRKRVTKKAGKKFGQPAIKAPTIFLDGTYALASSQFQTNFFHWHADLLPVAHLLRLAAVPTARILLGAENEFIRKSLKYLGFPAELITVIPENEPISVERLIFSSTHSNKGRRLHPRIRDVYEAVKQRALPIRSEKTERRIFLSRGSSTRRLLLNCAELEERFHMLGFQVVDPGRLSYEEQIRLFDEAAIVVGEHGGGFGNIGFCRPGTKVIEFFNPRHYGLCYISLAAIGGLRHHFFVGSRDRATETNLCEWRIDVGAAAQFVEKALAAKSSPTEFKTPC